MRRTIAIILSLLILSLPHATAQAQDDPLPDNAWRATYWNNPSLAGFWRLQQVETEPLDRDWGDGSPSERINNDYWSARWERMIRVAPGNYRFTATVNNGVRVWVDGTLVIDEWTSQWQRNGGTFVGDIYLDASPHRLRVDYFDTDGPALIQLNWEPYTGPPPVIEGWMAEYFNNMNLTGDPVAVRDEAEIRMNLGPGSPMTGTVNADNFSVRWTRELDLPAGNVEFSMRVDDGGRLFVDGERIIDAWRPQGPTTYTATVQHEGGALEVIMEYFERTGFAVAELRWNVAEQPVAAPLPTPTPLPSSANLPSSQAIVVDNGGAGFVRGGPEDRWRSATNGENGGFLWTPNHATSESNYNWARWFPDVSPNRYEVFAYIPRAERASTRARYWIVHSGQYTLRVINQASNAGNWISLGIYTFDGGDNEYISLADVTGEATDATRVLWDAMRWEVRE
ncbi:MAG: hypothetical protein KF893_01895 [Caldilineaceae bacterium]|nr:hypothetical protein [Caldilineaceae bacterium]